VLRAVALLREERHREMAARDHRRLQRLVTVYRSFAALESANPDLLLPHGIPNCFPMAYRTGGEFTNRPSTAPTWRGSSLLVGAWMTGYPEWSGPALGVD
jgi:hypothetical protein